MFGSLERHLQREEKKEKIWRSQEDLPSLIHITKLKSWRGEMADSRSVPGEPHVPRKSCGKWTAFAPSTSVCPFQFSLPMPLTVSPQNSLWTHSLFPVLSLTCPHLRLKWGLTQFAVCQTCNYYNLPLASITTEPLWFLTAGPVVEQARSYIPAQKKLKKQHRRTKDVGFGVRWIST